MLTVSPTSQIIFTLGKYGNQQLKPLIFCMNKPLEKNVKQISLKEVRHVKRGGKFPGSNNIN